MRKEGTPEHANTYGGVGAYTDSSRISTPTVIIYTDTYTCTREHTLALTNSIHTHAHIKSLSTCKCCTLTIHYACKRAPVSAGGLNHDPQLVSLQTLLVFTGCLSYVPASTRHQNDFVHVCCFCWVFKNCVPTV